MIIDLTKLKNHFENSISLDTTYTFKEEEIKNTDIEELKPITLKGYLFKNALEQIEIDLLVTGTMILTCAKTLKPVLYPFSFKIEGEIEELFEEIGQSIRKNQNTIDILPIIWENIVTEVPMRVISDDLSDFQVKGDGWKVITEEEPETNPELEKLKDLL